MGLFSFITDALQGLGFGQQIVVAVVLLIAAWELFRIVGVGKRAGNRVGGMLFYLVIVAVAGAFAIGAGWVDPNPDVVVNHVSSAIDVGLGAVGEWLSDLV